MLAEGEGVGVLAFIYEALREFRGNWTDIAQTIAELMALSIRMNLSHH
jgi:hypothetical protein